MKFSSALQFNAVPEWREHYIDYDHLKKLIYLQEGTQADPVVFIENVNAQCQKVDDFFAATKQGIVDNVDSLLLQVASYLPQTYSDDAQSSESSEEEHDSDPADHHSDTNTESTPHVHSREHNSRHLQRILSSESQRLLHPQRSNSNNNNNNRGAVTKLASFETVKLRRKLAHAYVVLSELIDFAKVNKEGVRKAYKKFDKVNGTNLLTTEYLGISRYPVFSEETQRQLNSRIDAMVVGYARLTDETEEEASRGLASMLREHIVFERNTVWRDLINLESQPAQGSSPAAPAPPSKIVELCIAFTAFVVILLWQPLSSSAQSKCLAIVVLASILWATEALPLFVTALMIPFLTVVLKVFEDKDGVPLSAPDAATLVFSSMWSPVVQVLIGGFSLAAALSKHGIAKALAQRVLSGCGKYGARITLLVFMLLSAFLCMWISNVASPVLLYSVAQPLLRNLPYNDPYSKALILGIALASNIGGTTSPIASPQNLIAIQDMDPQPGWLQWFFVALPVAAVSIMAVWSWLCLVYPITDNAKQAVTRVASGHSAVESFGKMHFYVLFTSFLTILLWCFAKPLESVTGGMGILAFVPLIMLFGPGCLTAQDYNNFMWTIVALAMGGVVLGKAVESCGLLAAVAGEVQRSLSGFPLFAVVVIFGLVVITIASFISHTVAALIVIPLVKSVGEQLDTPHPSLLIMLSAMLCSMAMALPTSGFPNVTAVCMTDEMNRPYVSAIDFMKTGIPASILSYMVVVSLGFMLCMMLNM
ncbi:Pho91 protein [Starmerella bacillaris]|uniref:Pho91 protein n=1 Tax=Starmerella bacillaris TaxID=1247836 RepID=A0AAV5RGC6_STABA|nr:Pho91 protein [Starmerella bacillaris]